MPKKEKEEKTTLEILKIDLENAQRSFRAASEQTIMLKGTVLYLAQKIKELEGGK